MTESRKSNVPTTTPPSHLAPWMKSIGHYMDAAEVLPESNYFQFSNNLCVVTATTEVELSREH